MKNERFRRLATLLIVAAVLLLGCQSIFAQMRIVGVISGVVTDPAGASVPNAKVVLTDSVNGTQKESTSNNSGQFIFPDLPFGTFQLTVTAPGFETSITEKIVVTASQTTDVPVRLKVGAATESVTVAGTTPVLETTAPLVSNTLEPKEINELPLSARQALAFASLVPGKTNSSGGDTRINNMPGGAVEVTVDGINDASNGFKSGGTVFYTTVPVRLGALEEVSVESSGLGADAGAESGVNIKFITKRGGDQYHGSAFYQPSSEQFNANSWGNNATNVSRNYARTHNFGGNVGGPLIPFGPLKNKLFFFFNYEYVYSPQVISRTFTVANPATLQGNYTYLLNGSTTNQTNTVNVLTIAAQQGASSALDPAVQSILSQNAKVPTYATQTPTTAFNTTNWLWRPNNNLYQYYPTTRFDFYITPKEQLTFAWNIEHSWQPGAPLLDGGSKINPFRIGGYFVWSVALQSTLSPTMFNEIRYGVQHSGDSNASATQGYGTWYNVNNVPFLENSQTMPYGATMPYIPQPNTTGRHYITTIYDTLTKVHGNHTITAGGSFRRTDWHDTGEVFPLPTYTFGSPSGDPLNGTLFNATTLPGDASGDFGNAGNLYNELVGRIASARLGVIVDPATKQYGGFINHTWTRTYMGGLFAQDRWRVSPSLTLTYGLRWEGQGDMYDPLGITAIPNQAAIYGPSVSLFTPGTLSNNQVPTASIGLHPYKPDYLNFAPNVGVAWNPTVTEGIIGKLLGGNKTVFRGSYGISYYDEGTQMFAQNLGTNPGKSGSQTLQMGQGGTNAFTTLSQIVANPLSASAFTGLPTYSPVINQANQTFSTSLSAMNPNLVAPYTINWSIGIQREIAKATVLEVRYVGNQGHRSWRTSNLNETNIFENGFLNDFKAAQNNLAIANGMTLAQLTALPTIPTLKTTNFANQGLPGQVNTPILDAAFGPRGTVPAIAAASGYSSTTFAQYLQTGAAGSFASTIAGSSLYFCRMMGSNFLPCTQSRNNPAANQAFNAPGAGYPINFFTLNPYSTTSLNYVDDSGWSSYNGLQVQLRKRFTHGLFWTTNFTFSKSLTNLLADSAGQNADYYTWRNQSLNRQPSLFDQRVDIQTFGSYELPIGKGKKLNINNRILDGIIGGWVAGSIVEFSTGMPAQLTGGANTFNNQASGVILAPGTTLGEVSDYLHGQPMQKVDQVGNSNPLLNRANATDTTRVAVPLSILDPSGKASPSLLTVNNVAGSMGQILWVYSKNNITWNGSMTKNFRITERFTFQLYGDAQNIMNHPSWGLPSTAVGSPTSATGSFGTVGSPGGTRSMTFRAKVIF